MRLSRSAAALAATAVMLGSAAPAVAAPSPSPSTPSGLYGTKDPTYDGVWRQSLALLAQDTVGVKPADRAVEWLLGQQCANGAFAPFRADPGEACDAKVMVDTNQTSAAVQALAALGGHDAATGKAVDWLKSVQNADGGWGYAPGGASDANSTSVVIGALTAVGERPDDVRKGGKSPYDALLKLALPCDEGGGFAFQPDKKGTLAANADATAAAVVGALGKGLAAAPGKKAPADCADGDLTPRQAAANGASYLADALAKNGHLTSALAGSADRPDHGNTADAVVALAAQGGAGQAAKAWRWLERNSAKWAQQNGPAAYAQLIFAAHATGVDPTDFGGGDLVELLNATGRAPKSTPYQGSARDEATNNPTYEVWWFVGACLVAGIGIGFLLSGRRRQP
ncbi:prenyltransferase/squalene oxidase repeat-containing protein [Streptomyces sp. S.PNR 29]|uniref:prenyltransferase/squalene oxidase repeat-containing protein n=1 Tax=Streptomyces sp. S.PNR 29 TaxID=2973805 RepID=UPI0025B02B5A|nr:prenyltransferase/squalene oxidase repeat-containing protein [Streptomyces sp. S.PNR 29]MDN0194536.1 terpene cyclase/mutase family protein [Streptomyces sp. S.PNR 29]